MKFRVSALLLTIALFFSVSASVHEKVVVVPLGKGYEPQNPLVIQAADFRSDGTNISYYFPFGSGYVRGSSDTDAACMMAPAYIPNGVTVTQFTGMVYDNSFNAVTVNLYRRSITNLTENSSPMAGVSSTDSASPQTLDNTTIDNPLIDTEN